jgi:hypothetical protein
MFKAPTQTPHLLTLLDDLPTRCTRKIARHLGISPATLAKYRRTGNAPRLVHLALFWETRWGLSVIDCEAVNRDRLRLGQIAALQRENDALRATLARLVAGGLGAANDALWGVNCQRTAPTRRDGQAGQPGQPPQPQPQPLPLVFWSM